MGYKRDTEQAGWIWVWGYGSLWVGQCECKGGRDWARGGVAGHGSNALSPGITKDAKGGRGLRTPPIRCRAWRPGALLRLTVERKTWWAAS
jgi:hypothetical protein